MDIWDKKKRSAVMAKIRSKDTKPEWIVRRYLYHRGYRYRKNVKGLPGTPDIVLRKYGVVIFINGCFWHGHDCRNTRPSDNADYWVKKRERNMKHDKEITELFERRGWTVIRIWECELKKKNRDLLIDKIREL